jgi:hypothetical protein
MESGAVLCFVFLLLFYRRSAKDDEVLETRQLRKITPCRRTYCLCEEDRSIRKKLCQYVAVCVPNTHIHAEGCRGGPFRQFVLGGVHGVGHGGG